ncbi:unnamed protein product [Linum tenue]|uniref:Bromo domain-containing protein n=1 Tax=Linum tenue TaxID=586396 RepID=A0AAV0IT89_9ROSI|nr:unnamed protein product [Linum tenue]
MPNNDTQGFEGIPRESPFNVSEAEGGTVALASLIRKQERGGNRAAPAQMPEPATRKHGKTSVTTIRTLLRCRSHSSSSQNPSSGIIGLLSSLLKATLSAASAPLTAAAALNANKQAFLNLVGQIAQENLGLDKSKDLGLRGMGSGPGFYSSSSSSSGGDSFNVEDNISGFDVPGTDWWGGDKSGRKRGRPREGDATKSVSNLQATSLSGLHPWSSRKRSKKSCQDPRYNETELKTSFAIIKKIMDMDEAASFSAPVDPVPNRIDARDAPMDFGTICSNLQNGFKYLNADDVYKDVECIWAHCLKYNKKGDYIVYLMKRVRKKFLKYWTAAGLRTEMQETTGQPEFAPSTNHRTGRTSCEASCAANLVDNPTQKQPARVTQSSYSHQAPVPPSSYSHKAQVPPLQPTTNDLSQLQSRINANDAGRSYAPSPNSARKQTKDAQTPRMTKSSHSKHQPNSSIYYLRRRGQSVSQQQPARSLVPENDGARSPDGPFTKSNLGQNGFLSTDAVNPTVISQNQVQPQPPPASQSQRHVSQIHEGSIAQPQHSEQFATASHAGGENGLRGERQVEWDGYQMGTVTPSFHNPAQHEYSGNSSSPDSPLAAIRSSKRRVRGPSRCRFVWDMPDGSKMVVHLNDLGQPIGSEGRKLASFLGTLARDGTLAPLNYVKWAALPKANKENMWQLVQAKFEIDPMAKSWVMKSLFSKWKSWKSRLKTYYFSCKTDEERMRNLDKRVIPDQWPSLVSYWNKEEVKLLCARNRANRAHVKHSHTSGSKSYATIREEERAKRADGKTPTRAELFVLTHTRKDGNPVNEDAAEVFEKLQEKTSRRQQNSEVSDSSHDTFFKVTDEGNKKHVSMYGLGGPSPATLWGRKCGHIQFAKMAMETKRQADEEANKIFNKVEAVCSKVEVMEQKYTSMEAQIDRMNSNMELMLQKMGVPVQSRYNHFNQGDQAEEPSSSSSSHGVRADQVVHSRANSRRSQY